jgi:hypothetical protein
MVLLMAVASSALAQTKAKKEPRRPFLTIQNRSLYLGKKPFQNIGANLPDLFVRFLNQQDARAIESLRTAQTAGIRFARCFGATWGPEQFDLFEKDPMRWFGAYDRMLTAADAHGILIVPSLLFNMRMIPEYVRKTRGVHEDVVEYLTPGSVSNELAVRYVEAIVGRYKNDPRILMWEIGNEYNLEADLSAQWKRRPANQIPTSDHVRAFLIQIATRIKSLDKNHLVTSGNADMRSYAWHIREAMKRNRNAPDPNDYPMDWSKDTFAQYTEMLDFFNPPPLDVISVHHYPPGKDYPQWLVENDQYALMLPWTRAACTQIGKPLLIGEFNQKIFAEGKEQQAPWVEDYLQRLVAPGAPPAAIWSWEYDEENPDQSPYTLSKQRTPALVELLTQSNAAIAKRMQEERSNKRPSHRKKASTPAPSASGK